MQLMLLNSISCVCKSTWKTGFHYFIFYRKPLDYGVALALALSGLALLTSLSVPENGYRSQLVLLATARCTACTHEWALTKAIREGRTWSAVGACLIRSPVHHTTDFGVRATATITGVLTPQSLPGQSPSWKYRPTDLLPNNVPVRLHVTDNGLHDFAFWCYILAIHHSFTLPFHPQNFFPLFKSRNPTLRIYLAWTDSTVNAFFVCSFF